MGHVQSIVIIIQVDGEIKLFLKLYLANYKKSDKRQKNVFIALKIRISIAKNMVYQMIFIM